MEVAETGRTSGRACALTLVLPLKWWGRWFLTAWFWAMSLAMFRRFAFTKVDRLRFIFAIRWSLLAPFERRRWVPGRTHENRWNLLFESNFDGDWDEYLDNFGSALNRPLRSIISSGVGYPGLSTASMFKAFAKVHDHIPEYYTSAYPELSASDIRQELAARYGRHARDAIIREGFGRTAPRWTTFLLPLRQGASGPAVRAARAIDPPGGDETVPVADGSLFRRTGLVHFARVVIIDQPTGSWLLITVTHDGPIEPIVRLLLAQEPRGGLRALLEHTEGVPHRSEGWWDDEHLATHLLAHRPKESVHRLAYAAYPGWTVPEIQDFERSRRRDDCWPATEDRS